MSRGWEDRYRDWVDEYLRETAEKHNIPWEEKVDLKELHKKAFLDALKEDPYDEVTHRVYADWLDENGMDDESLIHREWSAERQRESQTWLEDFVGKINEEYNEDRDAEWDYQGTGLEREHREFVTYDKLLEVAKKCLEGDYRGGFTLPFDTPGFVYAEKEKFWKHVSVVLWVTTPEPDFMAMPFRCAC